MTPNTGSESFSNGPTLRQNAWVPGVSYRVIDGHVEVLREGEFVWMGDVANGVAYEAMALPGTDDAIVTLNWMHRLSGVEMWHPTQNLMRIRSDGTIVWTAPLPGDEKSYTGATWLDGELLGFLWGDTAELDPETGEVRRWSFTE